MHKPETQTHTGNCGSVFSCYFTSDQKLSTSEEQHKISSLLTFFSTFQRILHKEPVGAVGRERRPAHDISH